MQRKKINDFNQALRYCYLLLKYRKRSEQELMRRLDLRQCPARIQKEVIAGLHESGLITKDSDFAAEWAEDKLSSGYGINRIAFDLMQRGISREAIDRLRAVFREEKRQQVYQAIRQLIERKIKHQAFDTFDGAKFPPFRAGKKARLSINPESFDIAQDGEPVEPQTPGACPERNRRGSPERVERVDFQQRQKLIRFLLSRGFLSDEIIEVLNEVQ